VVAADLDVGGHEVRDRRIGAAEHNVLAGPLQVVIDDPIGTGTVPTPDRLAILTVQLDICDVTLDDSGVGAVQGDAPLQSALRRAVDVAAIQEQVVGNLGEGVLFGRAVAQSDEVADDGLVAGLGDLQALQAIMMRARLGAQHRLVTAGRDQPWHLRSIRRAHSPAFRQRVQRRGLEGDPVVALLTRQRERAVEGDARVQQQSIARNGGIQRCLQVLTGSDSSDHPATSMPPLWIPLARQPIIQQESQRTLCCFVRNL
jgi:hypothetical protein